MSKSIEDLERMEKLAQKEAMKASFKAHALWNRIRKARDAKDKAERKKCRGKYYCMNAPGSIKTYAHFTSPERADVVRLRPDGAEIKTHAQLAFSHAYYDPISKGAFERAFAKALKKITAKK